MNIAVLESWLTENGARLTSGAFAVTKSENWNAADLEGRWFDLEGARAWGRVTVWPTGRADLEVIETKTREMAASWADVELGDAELATWLAALERANTQ